MEKYLLFAYADYYPCGGMEDCVLVANSIEELNLFIPQYIKNMDGVLIICIIMIVKLEEHMKQSLMKELIIRSLLNGN